MSFPSIIGSDDKNIIKALKKSLAVIEFDLTGKILDALAKEEGIDLNIPWSQMSEAHRRLLLDGDGERDVTVQLEGKRGKGTWKMRFEGVLP